MNKRKLLIIVPSMHQGGQERVVVRTSRLLEPYFDVTICIFDGSDIGYNIDGLNVVNIDVPAVPGRVGKLVNIVRRASKLRKLKKKIQPDISYSYGPSANIVNCLSRVDNGSRHDDENGNDDCTGNKSVPTRTWVGLRNYTDAIQTRRMQLCAAKADLVVCCARDIETEVKRRYPNAKTAVLYNLYDIPGILADAEKEEPDNDFLAWVNSYREKYEDPRFLMSMGRDDDQKMFWHMLRTFSAIHEKMPETGLCILGAGTWETYKNMAAELGLADSVFFAGMQTNPYRYLKYGDVNWMTTRNEGFPNALVEGMALGLAAVSTNALTGPAEILVDGGDTAGCEKRFAEIGESGATDTCIACDADGLPLRAIYGDYGILTPALDRERTLFTDHVTPEEYELSEVLVSLLRDDTRLKKYKLAASDRARDFTYDRYLEEFLRLADEI